MMKSHRNVRRVGVTVATTMLLAASGVVRAEPALLGETSEARVAKLVQRALTCEVKGQSQQRRELISEAVSRLPDYAPARWHAGCVRYDDQWMRPDQASEQARRDPRLIRYRARRDAVTGTVLDHVALARWCRKNRLDAEARAHWMQVLQYQPNHEEALRSLGLQWYHGMLLTHEQVRQTMARRQEANRALRYWRPIVASWRKQFERGDSSQRDAFLEKVKGVTDSAAIPALERELSVQRSAGKTPELSLTLVSLLGNMPDQPATESLVRHAVFSPCEAVRSAATDQLKRRPLHSYVTWLLAGMSSPLESICQIQILGNTTVSYLHRIYCEGALADDSLIRSSYANVRLVPGTGRRPKPLSVLRAEAAGHIRGSIFRATRSAAQMESAIASENAKRKELNLRIHSVLTRTTDVELEPEPGLWWQWWADYNELYYPQDKPLRERNYDVVSTAYVATTTSSCFARGTRVWGLTGLTPIELIRIGDQVLAQDADTGRLAYKPVLATTVRPPSPMLRITYGEDDVVATLGHPFWVVGKGWRMAKHLEPGDRLQGVGESVEIASIEDAGDDDAHNLIVADFSNYFAGAGCVLVHDNTMREVTGALLPGLMPE